MIFLKYIIELYTYGVINRPVHSIRLSSLCLFFLDLLTSIRGCAIRTRTISTWPLLHARCNGVQSAFAKLTSMDDEFAESNDVTVPKSPDSQAEWKDPWIDICLFMQKKGKMRENGENRWILIV